MLCYVTLRYPLFVIVIKPPVTYWISDSYLTCVTKYQLRRHLSKVFVIPRNCQLFSEILLNYRTELQWPTPLLSLRRLLCVVWTPDPTYESLIQSQCLPTFRIIVPVLDSMEADYVSYITDRRARPQYWDMKNPIRTWRYYCVGYYLKHIWKQVNQIIDSRCKNVFLFVHF